jgi:hypothetical protein
MNDLLQAMRHIVNTRDEALDTLQIHHVLRQWFIDDLVGFLENMVRLELAAAEKHLKNPRA